MSVQRYLIELRFTSLLSIVLAPNKLVLLGSLVILGSRIGRVDRQTLLDLTTKEVYRSSGVFSSLID